MTILPIARKHIGIVGKFFASVGPQDTRIEATFSTAREKLTPLVYAGPANIQIDSESYESLQYYLPHQLPESAANSPSFQQVRILQTPLDVLFKQGEVLDDERLRALGGELFVELESLLDQAVAFYHPDFDLLLTEGLRAFLNQIQGNVSHILTTEAIEDFCYQPEINPLLLAWLRSPKSDRAKHKERFELALARSEANFMFTMETYRERLVNQIDGFLGLLETTPGASDELKRIEANSKFTKLLALAGIPDRVKGKLGTNSSMLRHIYRAYQEVEDSLTAMARCEPAFALMVNWALLQPCVDKEQPGAELRKIFYQGSVMAAFTTAEMRELNSEFNKKTRALENDKESESSKIVRDAQKEAAIFAHDELFGMSRRWTTGQTIAALVKMFATVSAKLIPELSENLTAIRDFITSARADFAKLEKLKAAGAKTLDDFSSLDGKWMGGSFSLKALQKSGSDELAGEDIGKIIRLLCQAHNDWQVAEVDKIASEFRTEKAEEIKKHANSVMEATRDALEAMRVDPSSGLARAAPAGSARGVSRSAAKDVTRETTLYGTPDALASGPSKEQDVRVKLRRRLGETDKNEESGGSENPGQPSTKPDPSSPDQAAPKGGSTELADAGGVPDLFLRSEVDPKDYVEIRFETTRRQIFDDLGLTDSNNVHLAGDRARMRAFVFGQYLLARNGSVLGQDDRSLVPGILLHMVEKIAAKPAYEGDNRKAIVNAAANVDIGVADIPLGSIVRLGEAEASQAMSRFMAGLKKLAKELADLRDDFQDVQQIREMLGKLTGEGKVTIYNETIEEHAKRPPVESVFAAPYTGNGNPVETPPSVVLVSSVAFADKEGVGRGPSLDPLSQLLVEGAQAPFGVENGAPRLRAATPNLDAVIWGMPLFLGKVLSSSPHNGLPALPVLSIGGSSYVDALLVLTGNGVLLNGLDLRIGNRLSEFDAMAAALGGKVVGLGRGLSPAEAWTILLTSEPALVPQVVAKVVSAALEVRVLHGGPQKLGGDDPKADANRTFAAAVVSMMREIEALYGAAGKTVLRQFTIEGGVVVPSDLPPLQNAAKQTLYFGESRADTGIGAWFDRI